MSVKKVKLEIELNKHVAEAAKNKSDKDFGKDISTYIEWLIRRNTRKEIEILEKTEQVKPKVITNSETISVNTSKCEICKLPIVTGTKICKGIYPNGNETDYFVHKNCCEN